MSIQVKVMLDEEEFRKLARGEIVERTKMGENKFVAIQIALKDIGFDRMFQAVEDAMEARKGRNNDDGIIG